MSLDTTGTLGVWKPSGFLSSKTSGELPVGGCEAQIQYFVINHLKGLESRLSLLLISMPAGLILNSFGCLLVGVSCSEATHVVGSSRCGVDGHTPHADATRQRQGPAAARGQSEGMGEARPYLQTHWRPHRVRELLLA